MGNEQKKLCRTGNFERLQKTSALVALVLSQFCRAAPAVYIKSESHNPDSQQAAPVGANGVCPAQPGVAKADSVLNAFITADPNNLNKRCPPS
jgi:hypothetical protein